MPSDNAAARALARVSPLGYDGFIARMNQKADDLGLDHTAYADPSGLLSDNISSAYDMARLIAFAAEDDRIGPIMRTPEYSFRTAGAARPRHHRSQHEPDSARRRRRRARRQDRLHQQGRLLPGDAAEATSGRAVAGGRRARRQLEPRPLLGNTPPAVVALRAHGSLGLATPAVATAK